MPRELNNIWEKQDSYFQPIRKSNKLNCDIAPLRAGKIFFRVI